MNKPIQNEARTCSPLRFLSVCSGIEAASVAWGELGWKAVAFSEIEKFPSQVLAHHYPSVPNLGDFTKIDTATLGRVDILCGGTPCQAFSVAGLRRGLEDERGNLTLKFVELAHELAGFGNTDGNGLRNVVWENVVGVLSDKGNAFGCFLAGLVGANAPFISTGPKPADGKSNGFWRWVKELGSHVTRWPTSGVVHGPKGRAAWIVKDAQFFGVAQRRRRVLVVADFGQGADPAEVLFESGCVPRHSPPSREAGEGVATDVAPSLVSSGRGVERPGDTRGQDPVVACFGSSGDGYWREGVGPLRAREQDSHESLAVYAPDLARCVATREGSSLDYETTTMLAVGVTGNVAHTLKAEGADASEDGSGRGTPIVAKSVAIRGRDGGATAELGGDVATALRASQGGGDKPHVLSFDCKASGQSGFGVGEIASTLRAMGHTDSHQNGGGHLAAAIGARVRRLTPKECERLQGFPDNYTRIPMKRYDAKKVTKTRPEDMWELLDGEWWLMAADGPRYKALGNSWAVPKFVWLGRRLSQLMPETNLT
ncbi:Modification methylase HhaI [Labrenzia sp. THAF35]|uniref:DNA cytosine methyltransferase n=1 Tax=Labrenzia sp. THAF35 TaxID=2587854 RepID=UPI001268599E|nr:DNA cytosine methyltransferase [Labrenzia sp. THAF35]QFT69644.1 Modification methylase HhaI [Labrenzia sp. THAF35]